MGTKIKLTERDRANINTLAAAHDILYSYHSSVRAEHDAVRYNKDMDLLLAYGFEFGVFGGSLWKKDNEGRQWQVTYIPTHKSHGGGSFGTTCWYIVDDSGLRHKQTGLTRESFYKLFGARKPKGSEFRTTALNTQPKEKK